LLAKRAIQMCSLDARSKGSLVTPLGKGIENRKALVLASGTSREIDCEAIGG
jgi:hypothetical protein